MEVIARRVPASGEVPTRRSALAVPVRVQHAVLIIGILVLGLTGLPQRLDSLAPSEWIINAAGGIEVLRAVHRGAGAVVIAAALYHAVFVLFGVLTRRRITLLEMVPDARDYRDAVLSVMYLAGTRPERPRLRRPTYFEKLDYWVIFWGVVVMGLTGLVRLFPATATDVLPGDFVAAALELHSDLALLVVVWVVVIHLAYGALTPHPLEDHASGDHAKERADV